MSSAKRPRHNKFVHLTREQGTCIPLYIGHTACCLTQAYYLLGKVHALGDHELGLKQLLQINEKYNNEVTIFIGC